jgi:hypothetical protein
MPQGATSLKFSSKNKKIVVRNFKITTFIKNESDYISLTDIARYKDKE